MSLHENTSTYPNDSLCVRTPSRVRDQQSKITSPRPRPSRFLQLDHQPSQIQPGPAFRRSFAHCPSCDRNVSEFSYCFFRCWAVLIGRCVSGGDPHQRCLRFGAKAACIHVVVSSPRLTRRVGTVSPAVVAFEYWCTLTCISPPPAGHLRYVRAPVWCNDGRPSICSDRRLVAEAARGHPVCARSSVLVTAI